MPRSLFVTGGGGYIGRRFLEAVLPGSYDKLLALTRKPDPSKGSPDHPGFEWITGNLLDSPSYESRLRGCESVVHLAAVTGKDRSEAYFKVNTDGTRVLIDACRRADVSKILYVSTIAVKFRDTSRYYYAQSKKQAEGIIMESGLRYAILRPTIVLGEGSRILEVLRRLARAPVVPVFGDGRAKVQPIYVDDLVHCILSVLEQDAFENQTLEVGGPQVLSMEDLLLRIRRACRGKDGRVVHLPIYLMLPLIAVFEKLCLPLTPVTVGQLQSFINDGTITSSPFVERLHPAMRSVDEILASVTAHD